MLKLIVPDQLGSFLIELTISGALLAGLGLAGASFYKTRQQSQDYLNKLRELNAFHSSLTKLFQNSSNCNATFKSWNGKTVVPGSAADDLKKIYLCTSNCTDDSLATNVGRNDLAPLLTEGVSIIRSSDKTNCLPINIKDLTKRQQSWQVRDIGMNQLTKTGKGQINFMYELYPGRPDSKIVKKTITVNFKFKGTSPDAFISCGSDKESSVRSTVQEMCEALTDAATVPAGYYNKFAYWDPSTLTCKLVDNGYACPVHYVQTGIDSNGLIKCESFTNNVDAQPLYETNDVDCSGGKVPSIRSDPPDYKLRISC